MPAGRRGGAAGRRARGGSITQGTAAGAAAAGEGAQGRARGEAGARVVLLGTAARAMVGAGGAAQAHIGEEGRSRCAKEVSSMSCVPWPQQPLALGCTLRRARVAVLANLGRPRGPAHGRRDA